MTPVEATPPPSAADPLLRPPPLTRQRWVRWLLAVLLILSGLAAYANSFAVPFLFDDLTAILGEPAIRDFSWRSLVNVQTPVVLASLKLNHALGGFQVWGYHAFNLAVHLLAGLVLFGLLRRTLESPALADRFGAVSTPLAWVGALLWLLHPLQSEAVTYLIQRKESLMGLFYLLTLDGLARARAKNAQPAAWLVVAALACLLGMGSKQVMVTAPLAVLLYDRTFFAGSVKAALARGWWRFYLALALSWGMLLNSSKRIAAEGLGTESLSRWTYGASQFGVVTHYLRLCFWPHPLVLDYGWPVARSLGAILPPALLIGALLGLCLWALTRRIEVKNLGVLPGALPGAGFGGLFFFLVLAPSSSLIVITELAFEHRLYLPLAGLVALTVVSGHALLAKLSPRWGPGLGMALALAAALTLGLLTWRRNLDYRSELTIWRETVAKAPQNARAHNNLGLALVGQGDIAAAIAHYREALRLKPDYDHAHSNLGNQLLAQGKIEEAAEHFQTAIRIMPAYAEGHNNLGSALIVQGRMAEAAEQFRQAAQLKPDFPQALSNLGFALASLGQTAEALAPCRRALQLAPDFADGHSSLGVVLVMRGQLDEALEECQQALRLSPDSAAAHNAMGYVLGARGQYDESIAHFRQALRLQPGQAQYHNNLGNALAARGNTREALVYFKEALRLQPNFLNPCGALAWILATTDPTQGGDPRQAVELAQHACQLTGFADANLLDTLAAAYASAGRFPEAIAAARKAIELSTAAGHAQAAAEIRRRLELYQSGRPYREPVRP